MPPLPETVSQTQVVYRGQDVDSVARFMDGDEKVIPSDPTQYPTFMVTDTKNQIIANGVAIELGDGEWSAHWTVPMDADPGNWEIRWNMISNRERQFEQNNAFTVREVNDDISLIDDPQTFVFFPQDADRVTLLLDREVEDITLSIRNFTNDNHEVLRLQRAQIRHEPLGARTMWYCDLPGFGVGTFMLLWSYFTHSWGPRQKTIKRLEIPPILYWNLVSKLSDLVDRIQKSSKTPFGYFEEDLLQYMQQGVMEFNRYHPMTSFTLSNFPQGIGFESFLLDCSALWALRSRALGSGEINLNYSGQEATIEADRQSAYMDQINHIRENLNTHLVREKTNFMRHTYNPIRLGLRLGLGASSTLGGGSLLGGITSPYLRGFSRSRRKGSW